MTKKVFIASTAVLAVFLFLINTALLAQHGPGQKKIRLFIIGNSFSQNASTYLPEMTKEANVTLEIGRAELGGCSLERHWKHAEKAEANPNDKEGKPYKGKSLRMLLSEGKWDVVTLQQASIFSADVNTYRPYARNLYNYIKSIQPNAKIVLHQTWAYRLDASTFRNADVSPLLKDDQSMWENSRAAYHTIAKELKTGLFPVGDAFRQVVSNRKYGYKIDKDFDVSKPVSPQLPNQDNSLHVGYYWNKDKFALDANHASEAGKYLGSLVWFACLFNESPQKIAFVPAKVSPEFAKYLRKVADKVVKEQAKEFNVINAI